MVLSGPRGIPFPPPLTTPTVEHFSLFMVFTYGKNLKIKFPFIHGFWVHRPTSCNINDCSRQASTSDVNIRWLMLGDAKSYAMSDCTVPTIRDQCLRQYIYIPCDTRQTFGARRITGMCLVIPHHNRSVVHTVVKRSADCKDHIM